MEMIKLTGSEKQVAWAEEIRKTYAICIAILDKAIEILKDRATVESTICDPLGRAKSEDATKTLEYVKNLESYHQATKYAVENLLGLRELNDKRAVKEGFGAADEREREQKYFEYLKEKLVEKIKTETSAKYWIDNR